MVISAVSLNKAGEKDKEGEGSQCSVDCLWNEMQSVIIDP